MKWVKPAILVLIPLIVGLQYQINVLRRDFLRHEDRPFVPPLSELAKVGTLKYHNLVADLYWLRTIQYRERCWEEKRFPLDLYPLVDFLTDLDPRYCLAYFYAGLALMDEGGEAEDIIAILKKGSKPEHCLGYWKNPFLLGFYYYFELGEYENAADYMEQACTWHKGHKLYCGLASRIRTITGKPEMGLKLIEEMIKTTEDPYSLPSLEKRRLELIAKIQERDLSAAVQRYFERHRAAPVRLEDIFADGPVKGSPPEGFLPAVYSEVPEHPLPGHIYVYEPETLRVRSEPPIELDTVRRKRGT